MTTTTTTVGMVAAGEGLTLSAPPWLDGVAGNAWRPLSDVHIELRTAAAWRPANRSPLLRTLLDLLPRATEPEPDDGRGRRAVRSRPEPGRER